jgi:hypothetical protein
VDLERGRRALKLHGLKPVPRLDGAYMFDDADGGVGIVVRDEALEKIRQLRRTLYGRARREGPIVQPTGQPGAGRSPGCGRFSGG